MLNTVFSQKERKMHAKKKKRKKLGRGQEVCVEISKSLSSKWDYQKVREEERGRRARVVL